MPGIARGGKTKRYLLDSLPAEIQATIKQKQAAELWAAAQPEQLPSVVKQTRTPARRKLEQPERPSNEYADGLTDKERNVAYARMAVVC